MPPALHPKSVSTASLFTTTALLAFLVVGAPHLLPCPRARRTLADDGEETGGDGREKRRRRRVCPVPRGRKDSSGAVVEVVVERG